MLNTTGSGGVLVRSLSRIKAPKARRLAQHGGAPGWLEESDPAGVILYVIDGPHRLLFPYRTGRPDRSCPAGNWRISSCCYIINVHNHPSWATSHKEGMAYSSRPMPSLWSRVSSFQQVLRAILNRWDWPELFSLSSFCLYFWDCNTHTCTLWGRDCIERGYLYTTV